MVAATSPVTVLVCALGGEGGGVLAEWLYAAAVRAGFAAQSTSIPGVAQRTGATTYYVEVWPEPAAALGHRRPVFSLNPVPGEIDLLVSSELLETVRQVGLGMVSGERTRVLSSTARALTVTEKMQATDGRADSARLLAALQGHALAAELVDFSALASEAGTAISAVLLGAIAESEVLPVPREAFEETIRASGKGVQASLRGFALAFERLRGRRAGQAPIAAALPPAAVSAADLRRLGRARVASYQDEVYARLYDERMARIDAAEGAAGGTDGAIGHEVARWLALWMAFDDIVQVAALKLAAKRLSRVRAEVGARDDEIVKVYDHFKPGVPEIAALLPGTLATRLVAWDRRRVAGGREPWALPLKVATHSFAGTLALRLLASLKGWRRRGQRFATEQRLIDHWLDAVERGTREHAPLGAELARCGRLIKGYGSTNERGKESLLHICDHLAFGAGSADKRADAVRAAREAAFSDDSGLALDRTLATHGAPPRPPREQTIRWFKRRPAA